MDLILHLLLPNIRIRNALVTPITDSGGKNHQLFGLLIAMIEWLRPAEHLRVARLNPASMLDLSGFTRTCSSSCHNKLSMTSRHSSSYNYVAGKRRCIKGRRFRLNQIVNRTSETLPAGPVAISQTMAAPHLIGLDEVDIFSPQHEYVVVPCTGSPV